ncbi:DUF6443 domain-containing protein [Flavobacterium sp. HTF]|uniref:DUF6443 domain-containing protein n=1 Tax=Flavobacterium sp. HTF TaxID=2170732 RepID=UPI000D5E640C|nr:DUF6443 domain-containing protein [Flavobacterium sp. HTF]PWB26433.1 type IV secretion protein Rhs [Flavobacterium sp. HTF]
MMKKTKRYSIQFILLLFSIYATAQVPATIVKGSINTPYNVTGNETLIATQSIVLSPNTLIKSGSTFTAKIVPDAYIPISAISNENFILSRKYQTNLISGEDIVSNSDVIENISYYDGLGRPMQNIAIKGSPNKNDIVTHITYDNAGRQEKDFLPYMDNVGSIGSYRNSTDAETRINAYYKLNYPQDIDNALPNPFSQKKFDNSPLNRILLQAAPGKDWALGKGHEIKMDYQTNTATATDNVKFFVVTTVLNSDGVYVPTVASTINYSDNQLYKTITKDENWVSGKNNTVEEFKNKEGQVILKRTYSDYANTSQSEVKHDTYYIYDTYGNLTYVLPPTAEGSVTSLVLKELCYQYKYDTKNRLVEKKLPGKDWEFIVYDKLNRPILTQDANLRTLNKWLFTKYDPFSRPVYTGEYINTTDKTRSLVQKLADKSTVLFENKKATSIKIKTTDVYYSNLAFPTVDIDLLTINYYDDYLNINLDGGTTATSYGLTPVTTPKGLTTCNKVRVLDTDKWITYVNYYDKKGRLIYNYNNNNYQSVVTTLKSQLDFAGKVLETTLSHKKAGNTDINEIETFTYDHMGRLITNKHKINNLAQETISTNSYDNIGQLNEKGVGGTGTSIQKVNFNYNIRGWLTGINDINSLAKTGDPKDLFAFKINYNAANSGISNVIPLYNGNISETYWATNSDNGIIKSYGYRYDNLNRLKDAVFKNGTTLANTYNEAITYDKNGNIQTLKRNGLNGSGFALIDDLGYSYLNNSSNQLIKVVDNANAAYKAGGFVDSAANTVDDYSYDANGNMIKDNNKNITAIKYNYLNLPTLITFGTVGNIAYLYNASGEKVQKIISETGKPNINTDYLEGYQYDNNVLKFFPTAEGYVEVTGSSYKYIYQYKDHLGNIRLIYDKTLVIKEENNFYPFGLKQEGYNIVKTGFENKYKYNGKELQDELGLNFYDYGARNYDPALGRWMNVDPLSEKSRRFSPYTYALNNPVYFIDPDGMKAEASQTAYIYYDWDEGGYRTQDNKEASVEDALSQGNCPSCKTKEDWATYYKQAENTASILGETNLFNIGLGNHLTSGKDEDGHTLYYLDDELMDLRRYENRAHAFGSFLSEGADIQGGFSLLKFLSNLVKGVGIDDLIKAGNIISKGGYSSAGRALMKHGGREGSFFPKVVGSRAAVNSAGEEVLTTIITNPNVIKNVRHHAKFGKILEYRLPTGQGARFSSDGKKFIGFIEVQ